MAKEEGSKTVVVGGKSDVPQQYCGTVGGQSTDFSTIDTEVKVIDNQTYLFDTTFLSSHHNPDYEPQKQPTCTT